MTRQPQKLLIATGIVLALCALVGPASADTLSQDVTNTREQTQIWTTFALNPYLRAASIDVSVQNGVATLTGKVDEEVNKELAKQIALGVDGIREVDNQIVVEPGYASPGSTAAKSYGVAIQDASITAAIKSKLAWSKYTDSLATKVETRSGRVTLSGTASSKQARDLAERVAATTIGVDSVDNQMVVDGAKPSVSEQGQHLASAAGRDITDAWITAKVKSTFLYSTHVASTDISVNTHAGVVTLSGKSASGVERALAIELARNVRGVKAVHAADLGVRGH